MSGESSGFEGSSPHPSGGREDAQWQLYKDTTPEGVSWWNRYLWERLFPWMHLAMMSAQKAQHEQASVRMTGNRGLLPPHPSDIEGTKRAIIHRVKGDPIELTENWTKIQRILFLELCEGENRFARRLAEAMKHGLESEGEIKGAMLVADGKAFNAACNSLISENPGHHADRIDRYLTKHWAESISEEIPPLCCWKDDAVHSYLAEHTGRPHPFPDHFIEDRRSSLKLIKIPVILVVEWRRREGDEAGKPIYNEPPKSNKKLLRRALSQIDRDLFDFAFPSVESAKNPAAILLRMNRELDDALSSDVREYLKLRIGQG